MAGTEVTATVTNTARERHAQQLVTGKAFRILYFQIGSEGHDPADPLVALAVDPSLTALPGLVFGDEPVDDTGYLTPQCPYWECNLERTEAVGSSVSSIALIAEIIDNGSDPVDEVGTRFPYAIANMPLNVKTGSTRFEFTVGIQL